MLDYKLNYLTRPKATKVSIEIILMNEILGVLSQHTHTYT